MIFLSESTRLEIRNKKIVQVLVTFELKIKNDRLNRHSYFDNKKIYINIFYY